MDATKIFPPSVVVLITGVLMSAVRADSFSFGSPKAPK
jgi:hypothetical protein